MWKPAESLDAVRKEAREAIYFSMFGVEFDDPERKEMRIQWACTFTEFGVRSGLLTPDEGNEWLASIWDKPESMPMGKLLEKYSPE